eukprot:jgi/Bigna1/82430/fgenesh1_pg.92_\
MDTNRRRRKRIVPLDIWAIYCTRGIIQYWFLWNIRSRRGCVVSALCMLVLGKDKPVYDAQNNVERIELRENDTALQSPHRNHIAVPPEGLAGVFYLEVFGAHVPASAQKFAFVVSAKYYDIYTLDFSACANMTSRCINDCSGNGKCDTKKGRCQCKGGFGGADCGLRAVMMDVNISSSSLVGKAGGLKVGDWRYFEADLADLVQDDSLPYLEVALDMDQGSKGDPDLYINDNGELPTLLAHKFQDLTCDSCDGQQTRFRVKKSKLSSLQLVLGVYGHCCAESAFTIRFYQTTPPPHHVETVPKGQLLAIHPQRASKQHGILPGNRRGKVQNLDQNSSGFHREMSLDLARLSACFYA